MIWDFVYILIDIYKMALQSNEELTNDGKSRGKINN